MVEQTRETKAAAVQLSRRDVRNSCTAEARSRQTRMGEVARAIRAGCSVGCRLGRR